MPTHKTFATVKVAYCSLAQPVERMTVNHDVVSSSLTGAANEKATRSGGFFHWLFLLVSADDIVVGSHAFHRLSVYAKPVVAVCERRRWRMQRAKRLVPRSKCGEANSEHTHFGHRKRKHDGWICACLGCAVLHHPIGWLFLSVRALPYYPSVICSANDTSPDKGRQEIVRGDVGIDPHVADSLLHFRHNVLQ